MNYKANFNFVPAGEQETSLFQPDYLLPAQYFETFRRKVYLEPEKRLMLAVLEDGLTCFQTYLLATKAMGKKLFREAEEWIFEEDSDRLFSFEHICEVLGLNPQYVRGQLLWWRDTKLAEFSKAKIYRLNPGQKGKKHRVKILELIQTH